MYKEPGFKVFDPAILSGDGQGTIGGAGTFYSKRTSMKRLSVLTYLVVVTGTLAGTFTIEVSNDTDEEIRLTGGTWATYNLATIAWASGADTFGVKVKPGFGSARLKLVITSGSGTVLAKDAAAEG